MIWNEVNITTYVTFTIFTTAVSDFLNLLYVFNAFVLTHVFVYFIFICISVYKVSCSVCTVYHDETTFWVESILKKNLICQTLS